MPLKLIFKSTSKIRVEVEGLLPSLVENLSRAEVEKLDVKQGNQRLALAELFSVSGDSADGCIEFAGELQTVDRIGERLDAGTIHVRGNCGQHAGNRMTGGEIVVHGNAGNFMATAMRGGRIRVHGNAGHEVASVRPGHIKGMTGGEILIDGDIGDSAARGMRRGLLAVSGAAGSYLGFNMLAGTILVFGACGEHPGSGMRRGTIGLFHVEPPRLLPTFRKGCRYAPQFMPIVLNHLRDLGFAPAASFIDSQFDLYHGDMLETGRGEVLIRAA